RDPAAAIREDVLVPLGIEDDIIVDGAAVDAQAVKRICMPVCGSEHGGIPMHSEILPSELSLMRPALGALSTSGALADVYLGMLGSLSGIRVEGIPSPEAVSQLLAMRSGS